MTAECANHDSRDAAFVCQHLISGTGLGFNWAIDPNEPDLVWPDAWCDACEEVRRREGEWNDRSEGFAGIKPVCAGCYEQARERNWRQDNGAFGALVAESMTYLQERQDALYADYSLGSWQRYHWDQETAQLTFSADGQIRVVADIQFVGSVSRVSNTWLWSWANPSFLAAVRQDVRRVRRYGEGQRYLKLVSACWPAEERDGWEMAAVAAFLLRAQGVYRSPGDQGFTFMVMTRVGWAH